MTEKIKQTLRDSKAARWTALGIVSFTMLCGYLFQEIISPLKPMLESQLGWTSSDFGIVTGAYGVLNVILLMLIVVGILLDKLGIRFSAIAAALIMLAGAAIKFYAIKFGDPGAQMHIFGWEVKSQVLLAAAGFGIFGIGVEYAGITVSKIIVKWFKGKEMALAMGLEMACARLGSFAALAFAYKIAERWNVSTPVWLGVMLLIIGLLSFIVYYMMDIKLDKEDSTGEVEEEEPFRLKDIVMIITNRGFWYIAILCVLFYSAVFPFYKFGPDLMVNKFGIDPSNAGMIPSLLPFGTLFLTPFFGNLYDRKGKGASIMLLGAIMLVLVHTVLWVYNGRISYRLKRPTLIALAFAGGDDPFAKYSDPTAYKALMDTVSSKMIAAKPYVKNYWSNGDALLEMVRSGEVTVAMGWDNGGWKLHAENPDIDFVVPKSGALGWIDTFAIPAKAKNVDGAYKWINFILRPENAAVFSNLEKYATASKGAGKFLDEKVRGNIDRSFTLADIENINWYPPVSAKIEQLEGKILDKVKAAQ